MILPLIFLVGGLILLVKGADHFVESTATIAKRLGVSEFVIGLTMTAIGTSLPELASSISAAMQGSTPLIVGNIVGSNIANIGLIVGVAALIHSFRPHSSILKRDGYMLAFTSVIFYILSFDGILSAKEGGVLLLFYAVYLFFLFEEKEGEEREFHHFLEYFFKFRYVKTIKDTVIRRARRDGGAKGRGALKTFERGLLKDAVVAVLGLAGVIIGASYLIRGAIWLADFVGVPENLVGLSLIAIGTSLPELTVSLSAVRKGLGGIVLGNILGSNIANTLLIAGVSTLITPFSLTSMSVIYLIPSMLAFTFLFLFFLRSETSLGKREGVLLISLYLLFMIMAFTQGWA